MIYIDFIGKRMSFDQGLFMEGFLYCNDHVRLKHIFLHKSEYWHKIQSLKTAKNKSKSKYLHCL